MTTTDSETKRSIIKTISKRIQTIMDRSNKHQDNNLALNNSNDEPELTLNTSSSNLIETIPERKPKFLSQNYIVIALLFMINLVNFMDRFTIAGVLGETQAYFKIDDTSSGLLQTVFTISYMLLAPLFGYLGDRYTRKWIIVFGVTFWSLMTLLGSFVPPDVTLNL